MEEKYLVKVYDPHKHNKPEVTQTHIFDEDEFFAYLQEQLNKESGTRDLFVVHKISECILDAS